MTKWNKVPRGPRANEWLLAVLYGLEQLTDPRLSRRFESEDAWELRHGLRDRLRHLAAKQLWAREQHATQLVGRLTEQGRLLAAGGRDPEARWNRAWDGKWRLVIFDLPGRLQRTRKQLLRWLHERHFGYLQNSVWISPDPLGEVGAVLAEFRADVETFTTMEAVGCLSQSNAAVVAGAWDMAEINRRYAAYLTDYDRRLPKTCARLAGIPGFLRNETVAWRYAVDADPLLPRVLLPRDYLGIAAWQARRRWVAAVGERIRRQNQVAASAIAT